MKPIELKLESIFDYDVDSMESKVIAILDKDFNLTQTTKQNEECWLAFDKTCIYALSGGQDPDKGFILFNENKIEILDCIKSTDGVHLHKIKTNVLINIGDQVLIRCDKLAKDVISANHTAEHILQGALKHIIDPNLKQMGVSLTHDILSVSFAYDKKLSNEQLKQLEQYVNDVISKSIDVEISFKTLDEAIACGAIAKFDEVYAKVKGLLRVVSIKDVYTVLCAGRHVKSTKQIEAFKILKCVSKGSGVWKIEAIATNYSINKYIDKFNLYIQNKVDEIKKSMDVAKFINEEFNQKLNSFVRTKDWDVLIKNIDEINQLNIEINKLLDAYKNKLLNDKVKNIVDTFLVDKNKQYQIINLSGAPSNILNMLATSLIVKYPDYGFVITNVMNNKISYAVIKQPSLQITKPNELIKQINTLVNGRGGGKENQCQGSCELANDSLEKINSLIK